MKKVNFLLTLVIHFFAFSQESNFNNFIHFSVSEGLSQSTVVAIEQDQFKQMWIGTRDGINKYDGEEITIYRNIASDSISLSNNDILSIKEDNKGFIWIGTHNGLNRFDPRTETFTRFLYSSDKNTISHCSIRTIKQINDQSLWFASSDGLYIYDQKKEKLIGYRKNDINPSGLVNNFIIEIFQDKNDDIWIGTSTGIHKVIGKDIYNLKFENYTASSPLFIQAINENKEGDLWIGTKHNGLFAFDKSKKTFRPLNKVGKDKLQSTDIRRLEYDNNHNLWIGTYNGLYIKKKDQAIIKIAHQPGNPKSLSKNSIKEIFVDKNGSVWIGTYYGGVNLWDLYNNNFHILYKTKGDQAYQLGVVSSLVEDKNGMLFIGTEGNGVTVIHNNGKTCHELTEALNSKLSDTNIKSLLLDGSNLWIGTLKNGVEYFNIETKSFDSKLHKKLNTSLSDLGVYSMTKINDYLVMGTFGKGVIIYDTTSQKIKQITHQSSGDKSLTNDRVRCVFSDNKKNLWIGTDKGLNKIESNHIPLDTPHIKRFLFNNYKAYGQNIICIYQDSKNQIFVGTKEKGVLKLNGDTFEEVDLNLLNASVITAYSIVEDNQDNLWISSNLGMVKYNPIAKTSIIYNQTEGFLGNEFINNSYLKGNNGNLYFGGVKGVSFFNPVELQKKNYASNVILTGLKINGENIDKSISFMDNIVLEHDESSFSLNFAIPNYINTANNRYAYRLVGLNNDWKFTKNHEASYTLQKPGSYTFEVKDANDTEAWGEKPTTLTITVKAALWKTPLAYLIYFLIVSAILYQIFTNIKAKIVLAGKLKSERIAKSKQEEINRSKLDFFTNISHDFRTPLTLILAPLQQLIENYTGTKETYKKLLVIERNASQLLKLTNQLLDFRTFENKHSKLQAKKENLIPFLKGVHDSFDEFASIGNYTYTFRPHVNEIQVFYDRNKLEKVFYNILSNAFKYTPKGGKINTKVYTKDKNVIIDISDNGKGIDPEFMDKIFDRYYETASKIEYQKHFNQGSGIGLFIAKKAIELHKGEISVSSTKGGGTKFTIILRLGKNHLADHEIVQEKFNHNERLTYKDQSNRLKYFERGEINSITKKEGKPTILIVEDNDEFRDFVVEFLKENYSIIQANNGKVGLQKALRIQPDLIVSDVIMPIMEGTILCSKLKSDERTSHIPIILLTSKSSLPHKFEGLESGADAYIEKPFNIKEFLLLINNLISTTARLKQKVRNADLESSDNLSVEEKLLEKAIKIVESNIDNIDFDIPYFCSELGLSRTMLFLKIKEWTNLTPKEFINSIRMKKATQFLELGELSVSEVGYKVGFKDPKYFSKSFKKYYNKTPSQYAEQFYS
ncbi:two-component regulator propeller domain-containing protein [Aquimarina gracilis]|uniref:histidine kinase n=1 Tax=Aquimarina gracilis TaxID=874422 RepID=A0ABU5ZUQ6_9FLAO|nr:two-component regulator propeller domain-containing protein [Aquimarina gracilis]MEB3345809.1 two-component regulator propeller domain-containing protein [Aquimarina gracilis]